MAHLTRPAEISGVSPGLFPETAAGNRAYPGRRDDFFACKQFGSNTRDETAKSCASIK